MTTCSQRPERMRRVSDFRISDRVLVDTRIKEIGITGDFCKIQLGGHCDGEFHIKTQVHLHPGVSPEALLEELDAAAILIDAYVGGYDGMDKIAECRRLYDVQRTAREAAKAPKLQEGQEVWVRATVKTVGRRGGGVEVRAGGMFKFAVEHDDIRTD